MEWKDVIAVAALFLGVFNLWWTHFWRRNSLKFVELDFWNLLFINAGKTEVTMVSAQLWFQGADKNTWSAPIQTLNGEKGRPFVIQAGRAVHLVLAFTESFPEMNWSRGKPETTNNEQLFRFERRLTVRWVDSYGVVRDRYIPLNGVLVDKRHYRQWGPPIESIELNPIKSWFRKSRRGSPWPVGITVHHVSKESTE